MKFLSVLGILASIASFVLTIYPPAQACVMDSTGVEISRLVWLAIFFVLLAIVITINLEAVEKLVKRVYSRLPWERIKALAPDIKNLADEYNALNLIATVQEMEKHSELIKRGNEICFHLEREFDIRTPQKNQPTFFNRIWRDAQDGKVKNIRRTSRMDIFKK